jgi:hypothetical protein
MVRIKSYPRRWKVQHRRQFEPYWGYYAAGFKTKREAEELARKRAERTGEQYRVVEETEKEVADEMFDEQRDTAIETASQEALGDAAGRCTVPPWAFDDCKRIQEWVVGELRLQIMNDQDLYEEGPFSVKYRPATLSTIEGAENWAETAFKPHAEAELRKAVEIRVTEEDPERRREQLAHEIADRLWVPLIEQFTEIPREQRQAAVRETLRAVERLIDDYTDSLRANWPRRGA